MRENPIDPRQQAPQEMPIVPRWEFFQTIAGPGETEYPDEADSPYCYYAKQLKNVTFTEAVGAPTLEYDLTSKLAYVFNLAQLGYIPELSIVRAQRRNGRWWIEPQGTSTGILVGVLDAALSAPASVTGTPTTVAVSRYTRNSGSGLLEDSGETDTITNHDPTLTAGSGAFVRYTQSDSIYVPVWVGCTP